MSSMDIIYEDAYYMTSKYEGWFGEVYENSDYDYILTQYYGESFIVYPESEYYIHKFDLDYSLIDDFNNTQVFKIIGLSPTFEQTVLNATENYIIEFYPSTNEIKITDGEWSESEGRLNDFDSIAVFLNFSFGPVSSYSAIQITQRFNETFLSDIEDTFYDYLSISFLYSEESEEQLFTDEDIGVSTLFESINYTRNGRVSSDYVLNGYESGLFDNFELYEDDSNIIYVCDLEMDGIMDYKQEIDVNRDGGIDITKYGIEDEDNFIIWHTIIQDFESEEAILNKNYEPKLETKWFDIDDTVFANYVFNTQALLDINLLINPIPTIISKIATMFLPDVDFWAKKSIQRNSIETQYIKSKFYSVKVDKNRDGFADTQISYERSDTVITYEAFDVETTIIAGKPREVLRYLVEWAAKSITELIFGTMDDFVFNDDLTAENLAVNGDLSHLESLEWMYPTLITTLHNTFQTYSITTNTTYTDERIDEQLTFIDWENGTITETRIYQDLFDNSEVDIDYSRLTSFGLSSALEPLEVVTIKDTETGKKFIVDNPFYLPIFDPTDLEWDVETWEVDNVPVKFDSLTRIGEDIDETTNHFENTTSIRITNRYSLYEDLYNTGDPINDGEVIFRVEGMFITPPDGKVYYTSDKELFKSGQGKTAGHYFYFDSNEDGFYETVYILAPAVSRDVDEEGNQVYNVNSIGFNYDGKHEFVPYEKINKKVVFDNNFDAITSKDWTDENIFELNWVYHFAQLKDIDLLFPKETFDGYEPRDQIFDIFKLLKEDDEDRYTQLFYETKKRTHDDSWEVYCQEIVRDTFEQVVMTVVASGISGAIMIASAGTATALAHLAYAVVYSLMSKFAMDQKSHEAKSRERAFTFLPEGGKEEPTSISEKYWTDAILGDSMPAALMGHPGAYYTTVRGGEVGDVYTAQAIVSPPNANRILDGLDRLGDIGGTLDFLQTLDPTIMFGMDFDYTNLDYELVSSDLHSYNDRLYYTYSSYPAQDFIFNAYSHNTLGYLQQKIKDETDGKFDTIKPTCVDRRPEYIFTKGGNADYTLPQFYLYHPVIVDYETYKDLTSEFKDDTLVTGTLTVTTRSLYVKDGNRVSSLGMDPSYLLPNELERGYKAKIPLADGAFYYPIKSMTIDVVMVGAKTIRVFIPASYMNKYEVMGGNLYFTETIEDLLFEINEDLQEEIENTQFSVIFYKIHIKLERVIPLVGRDSANAEVQTRMALAQNTHYAIMEYFNQYTFAKTTASMIDEIGYTALMTAISTAISSAVIALGSYLSKGVGQMLVQKGVINAQSKLGARILMKSGSMSLKGVISNIAKSALEEVWEEIVIDGLIETVAENVVGMIGGNEHWAYWISNILTSARESASDPGGVFHEEASKKFQEECHQYIMENEAKFGSFTELRKAFWAKINEQQSADQQNRAQKEGTKRDWKALLISGSLKILGYTGKTMGIVFGGLNLMTTLNVIDVFTKGRAPTPKNLIKYFTINHIRKKIPGMINLDTGKMLDKENIPLKPSIASDAVSASFVKNKGKISLSQMTSQIVPRIESQIIETVGGVITAASGITTALFGAYNLIKLHKERAKQIRNNMEINKELAEYPSISDSVQKDGSNRIYINKEGMEQIPGLTETGVFKTFKLADNVPKDLTLSELESHLFKEMNLDPKSYGIVFCSEYGTIKIGTIIVDLEITGTTTVEEISAITEIQISVLPIIGGEASQTEWERRRRMSDKNLIAFYRGWLNTLSSSTNFDEVFNTDKLSETMVASFFKSFVSLVEKHYNFRGKEFQLSTLYNKKWKDTFKEKFSVLKSVGYSDDMLNDLYDELFRKKFEKLNKDPILKKRYLTKAYEVTVMSRLLKTATKEGTVKNAGKIFDGLVKALDDLISVSGTKTYNEIYENFATRESFGMLFNTEVIDMASYYTQKSWRIGALGQLDVFLKYIPQDLSRTIEEIKKFHDKNTPIDIKPIPSFDYNVDDKEISSSPSLSVKKENVRHPDCFLWEIKYWVNNEEKIKRIVYPTKWGESAKEKFINKYTAIDGDTALHGRNRETLAKNVETEIHILNKRQDSKGMDSFSKISQEISGFLYGYMSYIKSYEGTAFKVEQNKVWEQLIIEQLNMEILENFKSKDFKDVKDEDIIKFIKSLSSTAKRMDLYKKIIKGIGKDIPTLGSEMELSTPLWSFLDALAKDRSIISTWNTLKITEDKDGNILKSEISPFKGIHRSIAFDRYWGSEKKLAENSKIMDGKLLLGNIEFLAVYTLDKYGQYSDGKITDDTPLDRAFRIVNKIKGSEIEYALVEISQDGKRENPEGWFDSVFVSSKGIVKKTQITGSEKVKDYNNAILTENSGHLLSSLFFNPNPKVPSFITRSEYQLKNEENDYKNIEGFKLRNYKVTSWSESNRYLNIIELQNYIVPAFAPSGMKYELPPYKDYLSKLKDFRRSQIQDLERGRIPYKADYTYPITKIELQRLMFEVLKPSSLQGVDNIGLGYFSYANSFLGRHTSYATSLLGKLNLRAYESLESPNVYDLSSYRDDSDVEGIASALLSEFELQYFLTKDSEGEILSRKDISLKEWMYMIYQKVMGFSQPSTDRISELINEAKELFEKLGEDPIDLSGSYKKIFRNEELDNGKAMLHIIERLFGHATVKFIFAGMIKATKRTSNLGGTRPRPLYKIEVLTRPDEIMLSSALRRFSVLSPVYNPNEIRVTPGMSEIRDHLFAIFCQKASLLLPVDAPGKDNIAYLGAMPLRLGGDGFGESFKKYSNLHTFESERLFCDSGYELVEKICKLYDNYIQHNPEFEDLTKTQKDDMYAEFRRNAYYSYFIQVDKHADGIVNLRMQITNLFDSDKYCVKLEIKSFRKFREVTPLWVNRDDFDGVDFIIYGNQNSLRELGLRRGVIIDYLWRHHRINLKTFDINDYRKTD